MRSLLFSPLALRGAHLRSRIVLRTQQADLVVLARELLRDPYWPLRSAHKLRADVKWPAQDERARD